MIVTSTEVVGQSMTLIELPTFLRSPLSYLHLRCAAGNPFWFSMLWRVSFSVAVHDTIGSARTRATTGMPNGSALQVHLFSIAKRIATLGATGTSRVKMMIVTCLQHLSADVTIAIGAFHTEQLLIILLAIRHPVSVDQSRGISFVQRSVVC